MNVTSAHPESVARALDDADPLRHCRAWFHIPPSPAGDGGESVYLCGNSLGCMPRGVETAIMHELEDWATLAVDAHLRGRTAWFSYHEVFRDVGARLVGARPGEVVMMNSLTTNLHLMMVSFYRPTPSRFKIVIEDTAFPSDSYAVASQAAFHGYDPAQAVVRLPPRVGGRTWRTQDIIDYLSEHGSDVALVMLSGVNYLAGQYFDIPAITEAGRRAGCVVGWDLAHAAGNVPLRLHDWDVDFAAWCSYKYLNSGPGAVAGCFIHERHATNTTWRGPGALPRFAGWWGNDPDTRFDMKPEFVARPSADAWQLSNPPILAMAPLKVSLEIFDRVGMQALRDKSEKLTAFLLHQIESIASPRIEVITPRDPTQRGCQLSLAVRHDPQGLHQTLHRAGIIADFREPDVIRIAPVPMYNSFHDAWRFGDILRRHVDAAR